MADTPTWLIGRDITSITLTGATVGTDGTITDGTGTAIQTCLAKFESMSFESNPITEEISASSATRAHTVILQEANTVTITFITQKAKRTGETTNNVTNPGRTLATNYDLIKAVWVSGGQTWTMYGTRGAFSESFQKGRCTNTLTLLPCDPGTANPVIS